MVAKLPSPEEQSRATGIERRNYEREVRFYRELRSTVDVQVPRCFHADWDPLGGGFVLVLDECWEAYRLYAFAGVVMAVVASMIVSQTERGDDMFMATAERHLRHALDLDSLALFA